MWSLLVTCANFAQHIDHFRFSVQERSVLHNAEQTLLRNNVFNSQEDLARGVSEVRFDEQEKIVIVDLKRCPKQRHTKAWSALTAVGLVGLGGAALAKYHQSKKNREKKTPTNETRNSTSENIVVESQADRNADMAFEIPLPPAAVLSELKGIHTFELFRVLSCDMKLLLLGEIHKEPRCSETHSSVANWLSNLVTNPDECIDLFVEERYKRVKENPIRGTFMKVNSIGDVSELFASCRLGINDRLQLCDYVRYHYVDIRRIFPREAAGAKPSNELIRLAIRTQNVNFTNEYDRQVVVNFYLGFERSGWELFQKYIDQLKPTEEPLNHAAILKEVQEVWNLIDRQAKKTRLDWERVKEIVREYANQATRLLSVMSLGMDMFLIARIFAQFPSEKMHRSPSMCKKNPTIKNAIVLSGANHSRNLRNILKNYFQEDLVQFLSITSAEQCIKFNLPFDFFDPQYELK
jgi:hypothetical protein